ncbi:phage tail tube protein [Angustibacter luteus]|uniref:Phage tail tube protein n=1 Tax=Angustibacter luteus TaxID=658456 RepID=A0ABW1JJ16_9ACTN
MAVGSGIGGSFGISDETVYGTYVAPARFYEANSAPLKRNKTVVQRSGLAAGRLVRAAGGRSVTDTNGEGTVTLEVVQKSMGLLLKHIFGGVVTPVQQAATTAYLQTHLLVDNAGRFFSAQAGVPMTSGTVYPSTGVGTKITDAEFSCGRGEYLTAALTLDCQDVVDSQTLAAPSYPTGLKAFNFKHSTLKIGAFGSEAAVDGVSKVSFKMTRPQKTDRVYAGNAGLKKEPIQNDLVDLTGTIETDFVNRTDFADRFAADTPFSLIWEFVGANIASTYYETFRIKLPAVYLDTDTPTLEGPDVVSPSFNFTALNDLTNAPVTCEYMSVDVAL